MDHKRILGTEPSSVILSQTSSIKVENNDKKVTKQAEAKRDGVINPKKLQFQIILNKGNFHALLTLRTSRSRP